MNCTRVDLHIHSEFSDGEATSIEIINRAKELRLDCIAVTDHFDPYDSNLMNRRLTEKDLATHFGTLRALAGKAGIKVLCGIETCTGFDGRLRVSDAVKRMCDLIITSPHYVEYEGELVPGNYLDERYWRKYKEKVLHMARGEGDVLGHCESYLPLNGLLVPGTTTYEKRKRICKEIAETFFDSDYIDELSEALKDAGKALELHCATHTPRESVIKSCVKKGVDLSVGSDAHTLWAVGNTQWGLDMVEKYNGKLFINHPEIKEMGEARC